MTREERENALYCLKVMIGEEVCEECNLYGTTGTDHCEFDCIKVAIKSLEQEHCEDMERKIEKKYLFESLCEDLKKLQAENENLRNALKQETKTGHWLKLEHNPNYECSKCHRWYTKRTNFCPNCGIKIESEK